MQKRDRCRLCQKRKDLNKSHIIPSFVGKWLKETSVTGYLRQLDNPNLRKQDIVKQKLLCSACENDLSKHEDLFAQHVFYPYVGEELDDWGVARGVVKTIKYSEWLLKFIIGLQWRALTTHPQLTEKYNNKDKFDLIISQALDNWSDFLLGKSKDSGSERHYLLFLQNLVAGTGQLPDEMNTRVNTYLLRSVDTTLAISSKKMFLYSKMGPIVVVSGLVPERLNKMNDALVRFRGNLKTAQHLSNSYVNEFIFVTRPNEAFARYKISNRQDSKIAKDIAAKAPTSKHLHSLKASFSDRIFSDRLSSKKKD